MEYIIISAALLILFILIRKSSKKVEEYNKNHPPIDFETVRNKCMYCDKEHLDYACDEQIKSINKHYCWKEKTGVTLDESCLKQCARCTNIEQERFL